MSGICSDLEEVESKRMMELCNDDVARDLQMAEGTFK
jgi:hypothetical protein